MIVKKVPGGVLSKSLSFSLFLSSLTLFSQSHANGVQLPLLTLRDQSETAHCWAYAMSHLLESRSLKSQNIKVLIETERDVKYWVDFERMMHTYRSKKATYLSEYEGGWQAEFFESFLAHGKSILESSALSSVDIIYPILSDFNDHLPWVAIERPPFDSSLPTFDEVSTQLTGSAFATEDEAKAYAFSFLDRYYGKPQDSTQWLNQEQIAITESAKKILGPDFINNQNSEALILIKPVEDAQYGWAKYLSERYWGYRYDKTKILGLIETSLQNGWPVTFDNVYHAMTILAYESDEAGTYYAVADSVPGKITWYAATELLQNLNLVSIFAEAIPGALPPRTASHLLALPPGVNLDKKDRVDVPPR